MRIEIDEVSPHKSIVFGQTLLRCVTGAILLLHGAQKIVHVGALSAWLITRFELTDADASLIAYVLAGVELAAGIGLVLGGFTRAAAFVLAATSISAFASEYTRLGAVIPGDTSFELATLLFAVSILLMASGGGRLSLDVALRQWRRRRAIAKDPTWSRPEYVTPAHHG